MKRYQTYLDLFGYLHLFFVQDRRYIYVRRWHNLGAHWGWHCAIYMWYIDISNPLIISSSHKQKISNILLFMASVGICTTRIMYLAAALFLVLATMSCTFSSGQAGGCRHCYFYFTLFFGSKDYLVWPTNVPFDLYCVTLHTCRLPWPNQTTKRDMWDGFATLRSFGVHHLLRNKGPQAWRCPLCWQGLLLRAKRMMYLWCNQVSYKLNKTLII
jgi:hypothetical protein